MLFASPYSEVFSVCVYIFVAINIEFVWILPITRIRQSQRGIMSISITIVSDSSNTSLTLPYPPLYYHYQHNDCKKASKCYIQTRLLFQIFCFASFCDYQYQILASD